MRLQIKLPRVEPGQIKRPEQCPTPGCQGRHFQFLQAVKKPVRDTVYEEVVAHRYKCLRCGQTFRVYPAGVSRDQVSQRVKGLGVMLYLLGLSYGAASIALEALGVYLAKSSIYEAVQAAAEKVPGLKRERVFSQVKTPVLGADVTSVKCNGQWLALGLSVDDLTGIVLSVDQLSAEDAVTLKTWLEPIAQAVEAEVLVSDDADGFKTVADDLGLDHQVCKSHVQRNTDELVAQLTPLAQQDADGSLVALGLSPAQAVADLDRLRQLVQTRQPQDQVELEKLHQRYISASPPQSGQKASLAYRLRLLFLDRWNLWSRLTYYRTWQGADDQTIDGTNNGAERAIGWWIKERYRTMRGYKRPRSAVNLSRLLAWTGNHLERGGADLALIVA
jgi:hypothetical protein